MSHCAKQHVTRNAKTVWKFYKSLKKPWKIKGKSISKVWYQSILGPLFGPFRSLQGSLGATLGRQVAPQDLFFICFFRRAKRRADFLKFAYIPSFLHGFEAPRGLIFDAILETLFFNCFFPLNLKRESLNFEVFSFSHRISLNFGPPTKNIKNT